MGATKTFLQCWERNEGYLRRDDDCSLESRRYSATETGEFRETWLRWTCEPWKGRCGDRSNRRNGPFVENLGIVTLSVQPAMFMILLGCDAVDFRRLCKDPVFSPQ
jgi:hypothetical protein